MWLVAHRDWLETIRSKIFWVGVLLPLLILVLGVMIPLITTLTLVLSTPDSLSNDVPQQHQELNSEGANSQLESEQVVVVANHVLENEEFIATFKDIVSGIFRFVLFVSIVLTSGFLARNTLEEKSSKVVDMLFASLTPHQLMDGKILGTFMIVLTMFGTWMSPFIILWIAFFVPASIVSTGIPESTELGQVFLLDSLLNPLNFLNFLFFFMCGLVLYAYLISAVGSLCSRVEEARFMTIPINAVAFTGFLVPLLVSGTYISVIWAIFPFTTSFSMLNLVTELPAWPISFIIFVWIVLSILVMRWFAAKTFTRGMLGEGRSSGRIAGDRTQRVGLKAGMSAVASGHIRSTVTSDRARHTQLNTAINRGVLGQIQVRWLIAKRDWFDSTKSRLFWPIVLLVPSVLVLLTSIIYYPHISSTTKPEENTYNELEMSNADGTERMNVGDDVLADDGTNGWSPGDFDIGYTAAFFLMYCVMFFGIYLVLTNTTEEKSSSLGETLVSVVDPGILLDGKILGTFLSILTYMMAWMILFAIPFVLYPPFMDIFNYYVLLGYSNPIFIANFLLFLILGFAFYGYINSALGSFCTTSKEAQTLAIPINIFLVLAVAVQTINSEALMNVVSYIPPIAPFAMIQGASELPNLPNYLLIVVLMVLAILVSRYIAVGLYGKGLLLEKRPTGFREVLKIASTSD